MGMDARQLERLQDKFEENIKEINRCLVGIKIKLASLNTKVDDLRASFDCIDEIKQDLANLKADTKGLKSFSKNVQNTTFNVVGQIIQWIVTFIMGGIGGALFTKFLT